MGAAHTTANMEAAFADGVKALREDQDLAEALRCFERSIARAPSHHFGERLRPLNQHATTHRALTADGTRLVCVAPSGEEGVAQPPVDALEETMWAQRSQRRLSPLHLQESTRRPTAADDDGSPLEDVDCDDDDVTSRRWEGAESPFVSMALSASSPPSKKKEQQVDDSDSAYADCFAQVQPFDPAASKSQRDRAVVSFDVNSQRSPGAPGSPRLARAKSVLLDTFTASGRVRPIQNFDDSSVPWPEGAVPKASLAAFSTLDTAVFLEALDLRVRVGRALTSWWCTQPERGNCAALHVAEEQAVVCRALASQLLAAYNEAVPWGESSPSQLLSAVEQSHHTCLRFALDEAHRVLVDSELLLGCVARALYVLRLSALPSSDASVTPPSSSSPRSIFELDGDALLRVCTHHAAAAKDTCEQAFGWRHRCMVDILVFESDVLHATHHLDRAVLAQQRAVGVAMAIGGPQCEGLGQLNGRLTELMALHDATRSQRSSANTDVSDQHHHPRGREVSVIAL